MPNNYDRVGAFVDALLDEFLYGYVTIYDTSDNRRVICEGFVKGMSRIIDFRALRFKSFYVAEASDGGIHIDLAI